MHPAWVTGPTEDQRRDDAEPRGNGDRMVIPPTMRPNKAPGADLASLASSLTLSILIEGVAMNREGKPLDIEGSTEGLRAILKSQYHATLAMLRETIERCPDEVWFGASNSEYSPY